MWRCGSLPWSHILQSVVGSLDRLARGYETFSGAWLASSEWGRDRGRKGLVGREWQLKWVACSLVAPVYSIPSDSFDHYSNAMSS